MTTSETAHMLCNVLVQASTELLADNSMNTDSVKQFLRKDCAKLPNKNNLIGQVRKLLIFHNKNICFLS
jgi:hypothetical protein